MTMPLDHDIAERALTLHYEPWNEFIDERCALCTAAIVDGRHQVVLDGEPIIRDGVPSSLVCLACLEHVEPAFAREMHRLKAVDRMATDTGMGWHAAYLTVLAVREEERHRAEVRAMFARQGPYSNVDVWSYVRQNPNEIAAGLRLRAEVAERRHHEEDPSDERLLQIIAVVTLVLRDSGPMEAGHLVDMLRDTYGVATDRAFTALSWAMMAGKVTRTEPGAIYRLTDLADHPAIATDEIG